MIHKEQIIPMLLAACPTFQRRWEEHVAYWEGEAAGLYNDLAAFVHYLITCYEHGDTSVLVSAFAVLERFLIEGDADVQEHAALGIIETLQNVASHQEYTATVFVPFLNEASLREWNTIEQGWNDMIRRKSERTSSL